MRQEIRGRSWDILMIQINENIPIAVDLMSIDISKFATKFIFLILRFVLGISIGFHVGGLRSLRNVVVKLKKGAVESISIGEIRLSLRKSNCYKGFTQRHSEKKGSRPSQKTRKSRAKGTPQSHLLCDFSVPFPTTEKLPTFQISFFRNRKLILQIYNDHVLWNRVVLLEQPQKKSTALAMSKYASMFPEKLLREAGISSSGEILKLDISSSVYIPTEAYLHLLGLKFDVKAWRVSEPISGNNAICLTFTFTAPEMTIWLYDMNCFTVVSCWSCVPLRDSVEEMIRALKLVTGWEKTKTYVSQTKEEETET
nr:protein SABRE-like [Ipomoea batatas]